MQIPLKKILFLFLKGSSECRTCLMKSWQKKKAEIFCIERFQLFCMLVVLEKYIYFPVSSL